MRLTNHYDIFEGISVPEFEALQEKRMDLIDRHACLIEQGFYLSLEGPEMDEVHQIECQLTTLEHKIDKLETALDRFGLGY